MKTSPIYLDRLEKALSSQGVSLKRSQLLETAAAAFGYHNSNEFSAAAKRGDLTPPPVVPVGRVTLPDGQTVIIVTDKLSGAPYGIDEEFVGQVVEAERAEKLGISPYGSITNLSELAGQEIPLLASGPVGSAVDQKPGDLVSVDRDTLEWLVSGALSHVGDLSTGLDEGLYEDDSGLDKIEAAIETAQKAMTAPFVPPASAPKIEGGKTVVVIHTAHVDHKHGSNFYVALSREHLIHQIANFAREYWHEVSGENDTPESHDGLTDQQVVDYYFEAHTDEFYSTGEENLEVTPDFLAELCKQRKEPLQPIILNGMELPGSEWLKDVASALSGGVDADIWFDAHEFPGEDAAESTIEETQRAMTEGARILQLISEATASPKPAAFDQAALDRANARIKELEQERDAYIEDWAQAEDPRDERDWALSYPEEGKELAALVALVAPQQGSPNARNARSVATPSAPAGRDDAQPLWLTDSDGELTTDGLRLQREFDRRGLSYQMDPIDGFLPLTDNELAVVREHVSLGSRYADGFTLYTGCSALYGGHKYHAVEVGMMWGPDAEGSSRDEATAAIVSLRQALFESVEELGGHILVDLDATDNKHELQVLLPFSIAAEASSLDDYFAAVDYLINAKFDPNRKTVKANFRPQAWQNDYAVSVDPEGETEFDVTFELLLMGWESAYKMDDWQRDDLRHAHRSPKWVRDWAGPFEVDVDIHDIKNLFTIVT